MKQFGGDWTETKIEILVEYAKAYLTIMNKHKQFKTLYCDGFAGSGTIYKDNKTDVRITIGAARRVLEIDNPTCFDASYGNGCKPLLWDAIRVAFNRKPSQLYQKKLKEVFAHVSRPYELKNSTGSPMYHLFLASNNEAALRIGNDIVKKAGDAVALERAAHDIRELHVRPVSRESTG